MGQTPHGFLVSRAPVSTGPNSPREKQQNIKFFYMLVNAVSQGDANHIIQVDTTQDGHKGWTDIQTYYNSDTSIALVVQHYQAKMRDLELNADSTASAYINEFKYVVKIWKSTRRDIQLRLRKESFLKAFPVLTIMTL